MVNEVIEVYFEVIYDIQGCLRATLAPEDMTITVGVGVIKVAHFKSHVRFDLQGSLEAALASEATKMAATGNVHTYPTRVIKVADFKSDIRIELL